jgi:O-antigen/teichoic acid export membrane protein
MKLGAVESDMDGSQADRPKHLYGQVAAKGVAWATLAMAIGKLASFGSQFVLGWLLARKDFDLFAIAISLGAFVAFLRDGGTNRILMQQGARYHELARPVFWIALGFNLVAASIFAACGPLAAHYYGSPQLISLMALIALYMPLSTPVNVLRAKLSSELRFKSLARLDTISMLVRHGSAVTMALLGCGAYSFVVPMLIVAVVDQILLRRVAGEIPRGLPLTGSLFMEVFRASKWVMLATPFTTFIYNGDYLVVAASPLRSLLSDYFFGYQLTASVAVLFNGGLIGVIMPTLARLTSEPGRQAAAYIRAVRLLCFSAAPVCVGLAVVADPLIKLLFWNGKWDGAIPVIQLTSIVLVPLLLSTMASALIEAQGRWGLQTSLMIIHATSTMVAAYLGSRTGNTLLSLTLWVGCQHGINGLVQGFIAARLTTATALEYLGAIVPSFLIAIFCAIMTVGCMRAISADFSPVSRFLTSGTVFSILVIMANGWLQRPLFYEIRSLLRKE